MSAERDPGRPAAKRRCRRAEIAAALLLAALPSGGPAACQADRGITGVPSDSVYVDVMARLSLIERELGREPERADSARQATLVDRGVSAEALRSYARRHGDDPEHMLAIWRAIEVKVGTLQRPAEEEREPRTPPADSEPARGFGEPPGEAETARRPADSAREEVREALEP